MAGTSFQKTHPPKIVSTYRLLDWEEAFTFTSAQARQQVEKYKQVLEPMSIQRCENIIDIDSGPRRC